MRPVGVAHWILGYAGTPVRVAYTETPEAVQHPETPEPDPWVPYRERSDDLVPPEPDPRVPYPWRCLGSARSWLESMTPGALLVWVTDVRDDAELVALAADLRSEGVDDTSRAAWPIACRMRLALALGAGDRAAERLAAASGGPPPDAAHAPQWHAQNGLCAWCHKEMPADRALLDSDHVVPKAKGGADDARNRVLMHASCNRSKGTRPLSERDAVAQQFSEPHSPIAL